MLAVPRYPHVKNNSCLAHVCQGVLPHECLLQCPQHGGAYPSKKCVVHVESQAGEVVIGYTAVCVYTRVRLGQSKSLTLKRYTYGSCDAGSQLALVLGHSWTLWCWVTVGNWLVLGNIWALVVDHSWNIVLCRTF